MEKIDISRIGGLMTYDSYREQMQRVADTGNVPELDYSAALVGYTVLNYKRMSRWDRSLRLEDIQMGVDLEGKHTLLVITEGWCGDAAHINPVIKKVTEANTDLELRFINRDTHLEIIDAFLTNDGRSIPKAILLDTEGRVLSSWGPRPSELQAMYMEKREAGITDYAELSIWLQQWYNKDKGRTTALELVSWIQASIAAVTPGR